MQNIEEIYKEYSKIVYKYLFCLTHNEDLSEEIMQDTFLVAVKDIDKFRGECKLSVWLCQIAKHLWFKELRKQKANKNVSFEDLEQEIISSFSLEDEIISKEEKLKLFKDMQILDESSKEVMYLRLTGNLSFNEIAEILGKTPSWARVTFFRAKQKIREVNQNGKK